MLRPLVPSATGFLGVLALAGCRGPSVGSRSPTVASAEAHYATVNRLRMYYETEGAGRPLVLLHGAFSNIQTDFGRLRPAFSSTHHIIAIELQGHGHTADIDRPLSYEQMADDVAALLAQLQVDSADFIGYSMGGGVALQVAVRHPQRVRRIVWFGGAAYDPSGFYPELLALEKTLTPEMLAGTPWQQAYAKIAPDPGNWGRLVEQIKTLDLHWKGFAAADLRALQAPVLLINGDADVVRPEHAVEMLRLLGGGVPGDLHPLPRSQLAILPGTTHVTIVDKTQLVGPMAREFLDAPLTTMASPH